MKISSTDITIDVPAGWDAELYQREPDTFALLETQEVTHSVVHLANFALPIERGDFGSGAVEIMRNEHVLVVLFEYGSDSLGTALFSSAGIPTVATQDFGSQKMQRTLPGQSGVQYFFTEADRPFCLYVVLGAHTRRAEMVPLVNDLLSTVVIE